MKEHLLFIGATINVHMRVLDEDGLRKPMCARVVGIRWRNEIISGVKQTPSIVVGVDRPYDGSFKLSYIALPFEAGEKQSCDTWEVSRWCPETKWWRDFYLPIELHWSWPEHGEPSETRREDKTT